MESRALRVSRKPCIRPYATPKLRGIAAPAKIVICAFLISTSYLHCFTPVQIFPFRLCPLLKVSKEGLSRCDAYSQLNHTETFWSSVALSASGHHSLCPGWLTWLTFLSQIYLTVQCHLVSLEKLLAVLSRQFSCAL